MTTTENNQSTATNAVSALVGIPTPSPYNRYDERAAVADYGDTLDEVRANGLLSVCLGCGTTTACDPADRDLYARLIDWDAVDCCPHADRINY